MLQVAVTIWSRLLWIAGAGAVGACSRYLVGLSVTKHLPSTPYAGTLIVNALGCLAFGYFAQLGKDASWFDPELRIAILAGFLGSFTTFSSFSYDTVLLYDSRGLPWAAGYVLAQNVFGLVMALGGIALARAS